MSSGWTDLFVSKVNEVSSYCVLNFKYHHVRKVNSRKKNVPYFIARAKCKFDGCSQYQFKIKKQPPQTPKKSIKIKVIRVGSIVHSKKSTHKRHTRKPMRKKIAKDLEAETITAWYYKAYANMENDAKLGGNISKPRTQAVLRKIRSEQLLEGNVHVDALQELKILNDIYRELEPDGYIRFLSIQPFQCHLYLREQILFYLQENKKHNAVLYFDATGSVVQKIPGQKERIFLYSIVMKNPVEGRSALQVAEFLSNDHHSSEIKHFLGFFCNKCKEITTKYIPRQVETDLSWAIIQGVLQAFNEHNVKAFLEYTWNVIRKQYSIKELKTKTYCHTCSAHMLQLFIRTLSLKKLDKGLSDFILRSLSCLLNSTSIEEAKEIFTYMCDVMIPQYHTEHSQKSLKALTALIKELTVEDVDIERIDEEHEALLVDDDEPEDSLPMKKSKFFR